MAGSVQNFLNVVAEYVPQGSEFYRNISRVAEILFEVREISDGHGMTAFLEDNESSRTGEFKSRLLPYEKEENVTLDDYLEEGVNYNGVPHSTHDDDIVKVVAAKRNDKRVEDLGMFIGSSGQIMYAGVHLPADTAAYKKAYGIKAPLKDFMGYEEGYPGARAIGAICGTRKLPIFAITVGENHGAEKGLIMAYYKGMRIYHSEGCEMNTYLAAKAPDIRLKPEPSRDYSSAQPLQAYASLA